MMTGLEIPILKIVAGIVLQKLAEEAFERVGFAKYRIRRLQMTMRDIKNLLVDAEKLNNQGNQLTGWLKQLEEALYHADDVLDKFRYRCLQRRVEAVEAVVGRLARKILALSTRALAFNSSMGKIKEIEKTLEDIANNRSRYTLPQVEVEVDMDIVPVSETSAVQPWDVIGRDEDKEVIIRLLGGRTETLSVIPIFGIEGIGKTALARLVYNDQIVRNSFRLRMWIHESKDFNVERLIKKIIKHAEGVDCGHISTEDAINRLKKSLNKEERFLLVLDDVWNADRKQWLMFESLLNVGKGSRIIVTTRNRSAARVMGGTVPAHELGRLSPEASVSLFTQLAFDVTLQERPVNLEVISKEIVDICGGVPGLLTTTALGLYSIEEQSVWISTRDNIPKLRLDDLPSSSRPCLALSSIFPINFRFHSLFLIQLWMALDFIDKSNRNEDLEDIGNGYMDTLQSRCFIQNCEPDYGDFSYIQIDDLIHGHAREAARPEYTVLKIHSPPEEISVRHVSLCEDEWPQAEEEVLGVLRDLGAANRLRTILCQGREMNELFISAFIKRFRYVRVLDLSYSCFERLPNSIRDLIHLRLLSLRGNDRIRRLPNSLCKLYSLQTLVLLDCIQLERLPRGTRKMISLRHLEITTKQTTFPELGDSSCLRFLGIVGCMDLRSLFREGQNFPALRTLLIDRCGNLESLLPRIKCLTALRTLKIADCEKLDLSHGDDGTFPGFQTLWHLVIVNSPKLEILPPWILGTAASNYLQRIVIEACRNFRGLPQEVQQNPTMHQKFEIIRNEVGQEN